LQPLIDHLREVAQGRDDIHTECAGLIAGSWFASKERLGHELIAAGLLMLVGPTDLDELDNAVGSPRGDGLQFATSAQGSLRRLSKLL
jgi:hypothetical protein